MAKDNNEPESLQNANKAAQRFCEEQLDGIQLLPDRYCHRESKELEPETLDLFLDSLILEGGPRVPVVYYTDAQKRKILISGHRRVLGCRTLAERNQPGFALDMKIKAIELVGATPQDALVESVSDNENRKNLKAEERLAVVKKLHDEGVEVKRAARSLGVSDSTYGRDLKLVKCPWLYQHVLDKSIATTVAIKLIEAAEECGRLKELKEDLDEWIAARKKELKEKGRRYRAETGKEPRPADLEVRNQIKPHLVERWVECLRAEQPFDDEAEWEYRATIEEGVVRIAGVTLNTSKASAEEVAKVYAGLSQIVKRLGPIALERQHIERNRQPGGSQPNLYDVEALRQLGMNEVADRMAEKLRKQLAEAKDGEEDATNDITEERTEVDLGGTVDLPSTATEPLELPKAANPPAPPKRGKKNPPAAEPDDGDEPPPPMLKV